MQLLATKSWQSTELHFRVLDTNYVNLGTCFDVIIPSAVRDAHFGVLCCCVLRHSTLVDFEILQHVADAELIVLE